MKENEKLNENQETKTKKEIKKEEKERLYQEKFNEKKRKEEEKLAKKAEKEKKKNSFGRKLRNFFLTIIFVIIILIAGFFGAKYYLGEKEKEIYKNEMNSIYNSAIAYFESKEYDKALEAFHKIDEDYEKYNEAQEKIIEIEIKKIEQEVKKLDSEEDYLGILEYLNENYDNNEDEIQEKIKEYQTEYKDKLIDQIRVEMKTDIDSAKKKAKSALNILNSDKDLKALLEEINESEPIALNTLETFQSSGAIVSSEEYKDKVKDNLGTSYTDYILMPTNYYSEENFVVYKINKEYTEFTGKACVNFDSRSSNTEGKVIRIYGDDKLLYTSPEMKSGVEPFSISIDITGVDKLKIEMDNSGDCSYFIGNPMISK